jgi:dTDP-4-dehydrorhamnose reductase
MRILFFGANGWIASYFIPYLKKQGNEVIRAEVRADDTNSLFNYIQDNEPDRVVSFIGRTHGPGFSTIDYLEQPGKLVDNIRDNLFSPVALARVCEMLGIHYTYLGTGCIFSEEVPGTHLYTEEDMPDFFGSSYSIVKGYTDRIMHLFEDNTLNVRIRMPITADTSPRNFITKIVSYSKICSINNSMSVLESLFPALYDMIENEETGTINLVNPGMISHNEILEMYREIIDPNKTWENFTIEEQNQILASKRSNNQLDTTFLEEKYPDIPSIKEAVRETLIKMKENMDASRKD